MKCKKHPGDLSSSAGVCASCLRERLFALIAAQAQAQAQAQARTQDCSFAAAEHPRKSDAQPPPLPFPRSVSPYVSRRKSDHHNHHRFYSTPQVAPTHIATSEAGVVADFSSPRSFKRKSRKFSILARLFRSRSEKMDPDPKQGSSNSDPRASRVPPSPSWVSFLPGQRRAKSSLSAFEHSADAGGRCGKLSRIPARGMSPDPDENPSGDRSPSGNGRSSEPSPQWRGTPVAARPRPSQGRNVSGFAFCLSPLVRASPNRNRRQKGCVPPEARYSDEIRALGKPHLSTATSFCKNRSRKLTDIGRNHHNR